MDLLFKPRKESILSVYNEIINAYRGREHYLFDVLCSVVAGFQKPDNLQDYKSAFDTFRGNLNMTSISGLERIYRIIAGLINTHYDNEDARIIYDLIPKLSFDTNDPATRIILNEKRHYAAEWKVPVQSFGQDEMQVVRLDLMDHMQNEIVPDYIIEYVKGSVLLYSQRLLKSACALMTIAIEATLRDVLATKGYSYVNGRSADDQFMFAEATIDVTPEKDRFTLMLTTGNTKSISEYCAENPTTTQKEVRIRRRKYGDNRKYELNIRACDELVDFLSPNIVEIPGQKTISGLGAALRIARNEEHIIEVSLLPQDMDAIFVGIRNNLIHLSGDGLNAAQIQDQTLIDFVEDRNKVFDLISFVPQFISIQYGQIACGQMSEEQ